MSAGDILDLALSSGSGDRGIKGVKGEGWGVGDRDVGDDTDVGGGEMAVVDNPTALAPAESCNCFPSGPPVTLGAAVEDDRACDFPKLRTRRIAVELTLSMSSLKSEQ